LSYKKKKIKRESGKRNQQPCKSDEGLSGRKRVNTGKGRLGMERGTHTLRRRCGTDDTCVGKLT